MSDGMDDGSPKQLEWILDVKYVLFLILIALTLDVYFALSFRTPLSSTCVKDAYETLTIGNIILFICLFPLFYMISLRMRKVFAKLTYPYVSKIPFVRNCLNREDDPVLAEYCVNEFDLEEFALLTDHDNLYEEFKDHEDRHLRFVHVCDMLFAICIVCLISMFIPDSSFVVACEYLGINRWLLLPVVIVAFHWAAHAPLCGSHTVFVGKTVAKLIKDEMQKRGGE